MAREVSARWLGRSRTEVAVGPHRLVADEPATHGGEDAGPTPGELLLGALAA
jgi:putative redox protein